MTREVITEKQVGREFWYFAVRHASMILNQVPGRLGLKLTAPFELVHNYRGVEYGAFRSKSVV